MISQFNYGYDAEGEITGWQQQNSALSGSNSFSLSYDLTSQLSLATLTNGTNATSYSYGYDKAGNRTQQQVGNALTISSFNSLNQLTGQGAGGPTQFQGTLSKWASVAVAGNPAAVTGTGPTYQFDGVANLTTGTNTVQIVATGTSGVSGTNTYEVVIASGTSNSLTYDADGEMTNNGAGQACQWDAANRLVKIWYGGAVGSGSSTTFTYNGLGQRVGIVETDGSGNVTSTKQFVWSPGDAQPSEERDGSDNVTRRFYPQGEQISGTSYFYTTDHLGSVREIMDATGALANLQARYDYDMWGDAMRVSGTFDPDFGYAGYYKHLPSGLNLTMFRAYDADLGRWISRDPIGEAGGINLYGYVGNNPLSFTDPFGLAPIPHLSSATACQEKQQQANATQVIAQAAQNALQQMGQNPSAVQPGNWQSANVPDPNQINTSTWNKSWSPHAQNSLETPIDNSGYDLKMYDNSTMNVTYPTASLAHFWGAAIYNMQSLFPYNTGVPENAAIAASYLNSQGVTPTSQSCSCK